MASVEIDLKGQCRVYSAKYDDIYFNTENGRAESDHVFFRPNRVEEKISEVQAGKRNSLRLTEFGFGTGLNFFQLLVLVLKVSNANLFSSNAVNKLGIVEYRSVEKDPLGHDEMKAIFEALEFNLINRSSTGGVTGRGVIGKEFYQSWKTLLPGWNEWSSELGGITVVLKLYWGDVDDFLNELVVGTAKINKGTDVWFLDGFAPAKNAKMWSSSVFEVMKKTSSEDATYSTFTVAGTVRRGLMQAGFTACKLAGYGRKREMLAGELESL